MLRIAARLSGLSLAELIDWTLVFQFHLSHMSSAVMNRLDHILFRLKALLAGPATYPRALTARRLCPVPLPSGGRCDVVDQSISSVRPLLLRWRLFVLVDGKLRHATRPIVTFVDPQPPHPAPTLPAKCVSGGKSHCFRDCRLLTLDA